MIELYFQKQKIDIDKDIDVSLTYEVNDTSNPEAIKTAYSKTITIEGTANNNKIFGDIYRFDKEIIGSDGVIGADFNPNLRIECYIVKDGDIVDSGYFQLDRINFNNNRIQYDVTLYLGCGDFFYNLMYSDEEENEKTLASLYYGIDGLSERDENTLPIFEYNKEFVNDSWNSINNISINDNSHLKMFCPIPTYSGLYDDFDSDKVLINRTALTTQEKDYIPSGITITESGTRTNYTPYNDWVLLETPRELADWEIGDIRSHYQRLGVKVSNIYDAIKKPENNGGYEVDDSNIDDLSRKYINDGYLMLDKFDYAQVNEDTDSIGITFGTTPLTGNSFTSTDQKSSSSFDVTDFINPNGIITVNPTIVLSGTSLTADTVCTIYTMIEDKQEGVTFHGDGRYPDWLYCGVWHYLSGGYSFYNYGAHIYWVEAYDENNNMINISECYAYGHISNAIHQRGKEGSWRDYARKKFEEKIKNKYNYITSFNYTYEDAGYSRNTSVEVVYEGQEFVGDEQLEIMIKLSKNAKKFILKQDFAYFGFVGPAGGYFESSSLGVFDMNITPNYKIEVGETPYGSLGLVENANWRSITYIGDKNNNTFIYDGSVVETENRHVMNKEDIFANTISPFDFLVSLGKLLNWSFEKDLISKKIRIYSKYNYYDKKIIDISNDIDRKEFSIIPTTIEYNKYKFNLPLPDTYSTDLFKKKNKRDYGAFTYKPNYQFNAELYDAFEDNKFKLAMPHTLHSVFFMNNSGNIPTPCNGNKYNLTYWFDNGDELSTTDKDYRGALLDRNIKIIDTNDELPKLCCFNHENENVSELNLTFVLFNGMKTINKEVYISDDIPLTNDLNGNNCYLFAKNELCTTSTKNTNKSRVAIGRNILPDFSVYGINKESILFDETDGYIDLWNEYFKNDITNIYDKNSKCITIKYNLIEQPQMALKHFYYFDNSIWILNKINNYNPNNYEFTECTFIKVTDYENYCKAIRK